MSASSLQHHQNSLPSINHIHNNNHQHHNDHINNHSIPSASASHPISLNHSRPRPNLHLKLQPDLPINSAPSSPSTSSPHDPSTPATPRPTTPPHRQIPARRPIKSILKPAPPPQPKFNFKRDILNPFSSRLGYAAVEESPLSAVVAAGGVGQGVQAAAGWVGNAWKRLGAVAVAEKAKIDEHFAAAPNQFHSATPGPSLHSSPSASSANPHPLSPVNHVKLSHPHHHPSPAPANHHELPHLDPSSNQLTLSSSEPTHNLAQTTTAIAPFPNLLSPPPPPALHAHLSISTLKKVHFTMSDLKIIYPISNTQPPSFDQINKLRINQARRLLLSNRAQHSPPDIHSSSPAPNGWTATSLLLLYDECCRTREEGWGIMKLREIIQQTAPLPPTTIDLTGTPLNRVGSAELLGDLLSVDFGLQSLTLAGCGLEDDSIKPILHGLLVSGSLPAISLANNRKLRTKGWKMIAVFVKKAKALRNLDLSENSLDRRSVDYLVQAIAGHIRKDQPEIFPSPISATFKPSTEAGHSHGQISSPSVSHHPPLSSSDLAPKAKQDIDTTTLLFPPAPLLREDDQSPALLALSALSNWSHAESSNLVSLRLDNCGLKANQLDTLACGIRLSKLKHVSLRKNRIGNLGAVALAVMIRDWPTLPSDSTGTGKLGLSALEPSPDGQLHSASNDSEIAPPRLPYAKFESSNSVTARQSDLLAQRQPRLANADTQPEQPVQVPEDRPPAPLTQEDAKAELSALIREEAKKAHEQRLKLKAKFDQLPTVGQLLTLDVKANDLRSADVFYLAQVLKKNRTLKVLNLAENRIESLGLMYLADALRYNTCLETLDLSRNPCCGPNLEGIIALRTTCTVNTTLKRIFLSQTELSSQGAIAMAEFLPEMKSLIHLDLTENYGIDIAGVMALAVSVKMNTTLRCLDLNIPPNDPDFARLSQEILQSCVRNTELAQQEADQRGTLQTISQPMLKSTVVKALASQQHAGSAELVPQTQIPRRRTKAPGRVDRIALVRTILASAEETCAVLRDLVREDERRKLRLATAERKVAMVVECSELVRELLDQAKATQVQLQEALESLGTDESKTHALSVHARLEEVVKYAEMVYKEPPSGVRMSNLVPQPVLLPDRPDHMPDVSGGSDMLPESAPSGIKGLESDLDEDEEATRRELRRANASEKNKPEQEVADTVVGHSTSATLACAVPDEQAVDAEPGAKVDTSSDDVEQGASPRSPVESHSRSLTIEEGEVFRKGSVLGTGEEDEEVPGEVLKESILVAKVERTRRSSLTTELGPEGRVLGSEGPGQLDNRVARVGRAKEEEEDEDEGEANKGDEEPRQGDRQGKEGGKEQQAEPQIEPQKSNPQEPMDRQNTDQSSPPECDL